MFSSSLLWLLSLEILFSGIGRTYYTSVAENVFGNYLQKEFEGSPKPYLYNPLLSILPPGYKKFELPRLNQSVPVYVSVSFHIIEIREVDTRNEFVELDAYLIFGWNDWKIWSHHINKSDGEKIQECEHSMYLKGKCTDSVILDPDNIKYLWTPDIMIEEMISANAPSLISKPTTLQISTRPISDAKQEPGYVISASRVLLKVKCDMDFLYYPADIQRCNITIRTFDKGWHQIQLMWNIVSLDTLSNSNFDFQLSNVEPGGELKDFLVSARGVRTSLYFTLQIRRNVAYHLVQTYLPSVLLLLVTLLCFLLPATMVEAKIGVCMTTLLTMTSMFTGVREKAPEVSYVTAMDIWMVFSMFLIFLVLVLFATIHWLQRKLQTYMIQRLSNGIETSTDPDEFPTEKIIQPYRQFVKVLTKYSLLGIIFALIVFLITYALWILCLSGYNDWEPSPKYNAFNESQNFYRTQGNPFDTLNDGNETLAVKSCNNVYEKLWESNQEFYNLSGKPQFKKKPKNYTQCLFIVTNFHPVHHLLVLNISVVDPNV